MSWPIDAHHLTPLLDFFLSKDVSEWCAWRQQCSHSQIRMELWPFEVSMLLFDYDFPNTVFPHGVVVGTSWGRRGDVVGTLSGKQLKIKNVSLKMVFRNFQKRNQTVWSSTSPTTLLVKWSMIFSYLPNNVPTTTPRRPHDVPTTTPWVRKISKEIRDEFLLATELIFSNATI